MRSKIAKIRNLLFNIFKNNQNEGLKNFFNNKVDKTEGLLLKNIYKIERKK